MPGETPNSKFNQPTGGIATGSSIPADHNLSLVQVTAAIVLVLSVSLSLYQLYTAGIAALTALIQRSIHLGAILSLTFLLKPPFKGARKDKLSLWLILDWLLVFLSVLGGRWYREYRDGSEPFLRPPADVATTKPVGWSLWTGMPGRLSWPFF